MGLNHINEVLIISLCHFLYKVKHLIVPILQMKKLRHRDFFYKSIGILGIGNQA